MGSLLFRDIPFKENPKKTALLACRLAKKYIGDSFAYTCNEMDIRD